MDEQAYGKQGMKSIKAYKTICIPIKEKEEEKAFQRRLFIKI